STKIPCGLMTTSAWAATTRSTTDAGPETVTWVGLISGARTSRPDGVSPSFTVTGTSLVRNGSRSTLTPRGSKSRTGNRGSVASTLTGTEVDPTPRALTAWRIVGRALVPTR